VRKPQRLLVVLLLALVPTVAAACGSSPSAEAPPPSDAPTSADSPASTSGDSPAAGGRYTVATAKVEGTVQIYKSPDPAAKDRTLTNPRLINDDPKAKVPLVMLVESQQEGWLQVSLPVRPNGSKGWVRAQDFETMAHDYRIEITLGAFRLKAFQGDKQSFDAPIGVARDEYPTPGGTYYTTELLAPPDPNGAYGPYALGLSGHSDKLTTFDGGPGQLGIHGTNEPQGVGSKISHGCIRLKNPDITALVNIGMPLGTPVVINA
jgi:lipoprotein-anchoring transpeptidase ErfK/SrfK